MKPLLVVCISLIIAQQLMTAVSADSSFAWKSSVISDASSFAFSKTFWYAVTPNNVIGGFKTTGSVMWNTTLQTCPNAFCTTRAIAFESSGMLIISTIISSGQIFGIDMHSGNIVWRKQYSVPIAIGAFDSRRVSVRAKSSGDLSILHAEDGSVDSIIHNIAVSCDKSILSRTDYTTDYDEANDIFLEQCYTDVYAYHNASVIWKYTGHYAVLSKSFGQIITATNTEIAAYQEISGPLESPVWAVSHDFVGFGAPSVNSNDNGNVLLPYSDGNSVNTTLTYFSGSDGTMLWTVEVYEYHKWYNLPSKIIPTPKGDYFLWNASTSSLLCAITAQDGNSSCFDTGVQNYQLLSVDEAQSYVYGSDDSGSWRIVSFYHV